MRSTISAFSLVAALALALPVSAATFTVGPGGDCTHPNLQAALDSAAGNSGADEVRIVRTATWTGIQVSTDTNQDVTIVGGWAACSSQQPTGKTTLDGTGGQARSVIALRGNANFTLRNLEITGGDQAGDDDGGGVHFQGGGILRIEDSVITDNEADEGGGIYAHGTTTTAELIIGANVAITGNTARRHGGGVVAQGIEMSMIAPGSILWSNTAGGHGGGLMVRSGDFASYAYIGSNGFGGLTVWDNRAARGGGIAVVGGTESSRPAEVQVFSTSSSVPVRIQDNFASERGGGIDLQPDGDGLNHNASASAQLRNVDILLNDAPVGAAINLAYGNFGIGGKNAIGGTVFFNVPATEFSYPPMHPAAAPCPFGAPCGYIRNNTTGNTTGAVVYFSEGADFYGSRIAIEDNTGGWLMYLSGEEYMALQLDNSLIARNTVQNALIRDDQNSDYSLPTVDLSYLTIAGNTLGANGVFSINEDMALTRSIVDQPGKALFATDVGSSGGSRTIEQVIANTSTTPGGVTFAEPRFVDAANGDYLPKAGARAVDFATPDGFLNFDLYSQPRIVGLPINPNESGIADAGAIERQSLQPLVLNPDFDIDLNQWQQLAPSSRDATQNASGPAGSGSVLATVATDQSRVAVRSQCIHVPGPGLYALDGWGRVTGVAPFAPPNRVWLDWKLSNSFVDDGCTTFTAVSSGSLQLASGSTWATPASPAFINVPAASWTEFTTLTVTLVVQNGSPVAPGGDGTNAVLGGPSGWFDGITLSTGFDDTIFRDGFE